MADRRSREQSSTIEPTPVPRRRRPDTNRGIPAVAVIGVALVALVAVGGLIMAGETLRGADSGGQAATPPAASPARSATDGAAPAASPGTSASQPPAGTPGVIPTAGNVKGSASAPVQIVEYADFQCPFCGQAARGPLKQVDEVYVATGKARMVFKHFAFLGPESQDAAVAAECAGEQGKFWEYHDKLFSNQQGENRGAFARDRLKGFARDLGLERQQFDACLDSNKYLDKIKMDFAEGERVGVRSTPTFLINDQRLLGARPFQDFARVIDQELEKAR